MKRIAFYLALLMLMSGCGTTEENPKGSQGSKSSKAANIDIEATTEWSDEGDYVMEVDEDRFLAVAKKAQDFSATGGMSKYYSAIYFQFPEASQKLHIGQRVIVKASGPIAESYPGQGHAESVKILPVYQPDGADLTEVQVIQKALALSEEKKKGWKVVSGLSFEVKEAKWKVEFLIPNENEEKFEIEIADK